MAVLNAAKGKGDVNNGLNRYSVQSELTLVALRWGLIQA